MNAHFALLIAKHGAEAIGPWAVLAIAVLGLYAIGGWMVRSVKIAEESDPASPVKIETFNDNFQATEFVARLEEAGIQATAVGGYVSKSSAVYG